MADSKTKKDVAKSNHERNKRCGFTLPPMTPQERYLLEHANVIEDVIDDKNADE